jgi:hypothetical protein
MHFLLNKEPDKPVNSNIQAFPIKWIYQIKNCIKILRKKTLSNLLKNWQRNTLFQIINQHNSAVIYFEKT